MTSSHQGPPDVVIVGAGTAGCVLAARLSEDPTRRVLVLEAGPDFPSVAALPRSLTEGEGEEYRWDLEATVVPGRAEPLARGRVVGGSGQINGAGALRAPAADFTAWAALGLPAWRWEAVLPSYRRLETDLEFGDRPHHGAAGPVPITRSPYEPLMAPVAGFAEAVVAAGHDWCEDMNAPDAWGIGLYPKNRRGLLRMSTNLTHLVPARSRANLVVRGGVTVDRVVVRGGRAVGVQAGPEFIAAREVVLAAGAPQSPALLLRSGVGPAAQLRAAGVTPLVDLPGVGARLYDQPGAVIPGLPAPGTLPADAPVTQVIGRLLGGVYLNVFLGPPPGETEPMTTIMVGDLEPRSRGTVRLDPAGGTVVDLGFAADLPRLCELYRQAWAIAQHPAFRATVAAFVMADERTVADDERLDALVRGHVFSRLTVAGGAPMGTDADPDAVVDAGCRVRGVDGLRVVDLSVVPVPVRATTAVEAMLIGEHTAAMF